jgi:hypothetical protein
VNGDRLQATYPMAKDRATSVHWDTGVTAMNQMTRVTWRRNREPATHSQCGRVEHLARLSERRVTAGNVWVRPTCWRQ